MNEIYFPTNFNAATYFFWPTNYFFAAELTTSTAVATMRPIYMDIVGARITWR